MKKYAKNTQHGFTIVELLIVIVVIGILAAITVVAYNGIQSRARNAQLLAAIDSYEKAVRMYMAEHDGNVPASPLDGSDYPMLVCLGDDYTAGGGFASDACFVSYEEDGASATVASSDGVLNDTFRRYLPQLPRVAQDIFELKEQGIVIMRSRGLLYQGYNNVGSDTAATIAYYIDGDQVCGRGRKTMVDFEGQQVTLCQVFIR